MDYMSGFPSTKHGHDCVFVVVDGSLRWPFWHHVKRVSQLRPLLGSSLSMFGFILGYHGPLF
jgi:hypothetical protein